MSSGALVAPWRAVELRSQGPLSLLTLAAVNVVGVAAFLYPFVLSEAEPSGPGQARTDDAPLIFALVLALALLLFALELTRRGLNAKTVSVLAVAIVVAAALRVPALPAGASAFFFLVVVAGYVFGARMGFLLGAGAMFVSSFIVGGVGPWLPFQMYAAGWLGMSAGWLGIAIAGRLRYHQRVELGALIAFGVGWGFLYGAIMNLWFWPYVAQGESISWQPGMGLLETAEHYWSFYLLTSLGWDAMAAAGNVALLLIAGRPALDLLVRYRDRFQIRFD